MAEKALEERALQNPGRPHFDLRELGEKRQFSAGWLLCEIPHNDKKPTWMYKCQTTIPIKQSIADVDMNRLFIAPALLVLIVPLCETGDFAPGFQSR